jgi:hypothetical protein
VTAVSIAGKAPGYPHPEGLALHDLIVNFMVLGGGADLAKLRTTFIMEENISLEERPIHCNPPHHKPSHSFDQKIRIRVGPTLDSNDLCNGPVRKQIILCRLYSINLHRFLGPSGLSISTVQ